MQRKYGAVKVVTVIEKDLMQHGMKVLDSEGKEKMVLLQ